MQGELCWMLYKLLLKAVKEAKEMGLKTSTTTVRFGVIGGAIQEVINAC